MSGDGFFLKVWPLRLLVASGAVGIVALVLALAHGPLIATGIGAAARLAGYNVRYDDLRIRGGHVVISHPDVSSLGGEPVLTAQTLDIAYDTRTLGRGPHFYGISGIEIDRPKLTIVHHRDGSYNVNLPRPKPGATSAPFVLPQIHVVVRDGSVGFLDDTRIFRHSRRFALGALKIDANVDPHALSRFVFSTTLVEDGGRFPIEGRGRFDPARGYELSHVTAPSLALAPLLDYAVNSTALHFAGGTLHGIDARVYGLQDRGGTIVRHVSVTARIDHFQPYLNGLAKPLRDGRGNLRIYDSGLAIPQIDGSIAGVPVRIAGAIYDLAHPTLRLGITGAGDLTKLLSLADGAKHVPLSGALAFKLFVEGDATAPQTLASFQSRHLIYDRIALDDPSGLVALAGPETAIVRSSARYDGFDVGARGRILSVKNHADLDLVASFAGPAATVPYASIIAPEMQLGGTAVVRGIETRLTASGSIAGDSATQHLSGSFALDGRGVGTIGPLAIAGPGASSLLAFATLDAPGFRSGAAYIHASRFAFSTARAGVAFPPIRGTLDANVATAFTSGRFVAGGDARLENADLFGAHVDEFAARAHVGDDGRIALDGRYRGSLAALAGASGQRSRVRGTADIPVSVLASSSRDALVAVDDARFAHASIGGVAVQALSATIGVRGSAYDVYAARATIAGHDVVARGSFGTGGSLAVSARDIDLAAFRELGLPVRAGSVTALADLAGTLAAPLLTGGISARDLPVPGHVRGLRDIDANASLAYAGDTLVVRDGLVLAGATVGSLDGRVAGLRASGAPTYAFDTRVRQAEVADVAAASGVALSYPEGSLDADLHVAGSGSQPAISGRIAIPEGSLNGLSFRRASVAIAGTLANFRATGGRVTVGSSTLGFDATTGASAGAQSVAIHAPRIDLADFNDYFDRGDTLGGTGSIAFSARDLAQALATDGRVRLNHARVRRFDLGTARADWSTRASTVTLDAALGGVGGTLSTSGTLGLATREPLRDALHRTNIDLVTHARGVDLGLWLPAVGVQVPLLGRVDSDLRARGRFPEIALDAHAALVDGLVGRVAVRSATLVLHGVRGRVSLDAARVEIDHLQIDAHGTAGLHPSDPLDVRFAATTPDFGALSKTITGKMLDASGSLATTIDVSGSFARPLARALVDGTNLRYHTYTLPSAHLDAALEPTRLSVAQAAVNFADGRLIATGFAPIVRGHGGLTVGPASAPIELSLAAEKIGLGQFGAFLPKGTTAAGSLDGVVGIGGSIANPALLGTLALADGTFVGPQFRSKLERARAELTFAGSSARLHDASASIGGGTLTADGEASVPSLRAPGRDLTYALNLHSANALIDAPQYLRGRIDGDLALTRKPDRLPLLAGTLALASTRVPLSAVFNPNAPQNVATAAPLALALDLTVVAGRDVRVLGGPADVGAQGSVRIGGTLANPTASGELDSTGGTIGFYRTFRLQYPSTVIFDPSNGVIPNIDAIATTTVDNPQTDVSLHVTGPATQLDVALASNPNYSREQILGLLVGAQALGAVSGIQTTSGGVRQNPFTALAQGQLGTLLTQNILEPLSSQLGGVFGLSNLAINYSLGGSFDIGAQKKLFKNVSAVFAESFNYPPRQSIGLRANPSDATAIQFTVFSQPASNRFDTFSANAALQSSNQSVTSAQPANGSNGFSLSIQRKFR